MSPFDPICFDVEIQWTQLVQLATFVTEFERYESWISTQILHPVQAAFGSELPLLVEDPQSATIQRLAQDLHRSSPGSSLQHGNAVIPQPSNDAAATSVWVGRSPFSIKLRLFCLPYAGGVSENVFAR